MKHNNILTGIFSFTFIAFTVFSANGQAFRKGSFEINLSEGKSYANYNTGDMNSGSKEFGCHVIGDRDPIQLEYGISSRWGIGISCGEDFYYVNPSSFYGFGNVNQVKSESSELTFDCSYHFFVTPVTDLSLVASLGSSSISMKGNIGDNNYQYTANGGMMRLGVHARFFVFKHFGLLAMVSTYSTSDSPKGVEGNTVGGNYSTSISGFSVEGGICFRFKK